MIIQIIMIIIDHQGGGGREAGGRGPVQVRRQERDGGDQRDSAPPGRAPAGCR